MEILKKRPFWWHLFINKVMNEPRITFLRDTTMIISVYELTHNQVEIVYEITKGLLNIEAIKKVIKKKEFMILHFHSMKIIEYLHNKTKWMVISLYYLIKENYPLYECFLDITWKKGEEMIPIDLFLRNDNNIVFINVNQAIPYSLEQYQIKKVYLIKGDNLEPNLPNEYFIIKYHYNSTNFLKNIKTSFDSLAI